MNATVTSWNIGALLVGGSASTTATATGARSGMSVLITPTSDPGVGVTWYGYVSSNDTVTVKIVAIIALTPNTINWNVRVIP